MNVDLFMNLSKKIFESKCISILLTTITQYLAYFQCYEFLMFSSRYLIPQDDEINLKIYSGKNLFP